MDEKPARKSKARDNEQPKKKPEKSNLPLILGLVGCGGLLLLGCCVAGGGGAIWYYNKSDPAKKDAVAQDKGKDAKIEPGKDKGADDKKGSNVSKLKKAYEQIRIDDHIDKIEAMMGGRGDIGSEFIPRLTDKKLAASIGKDMRVLGINVIRSWKEEESGETLVIGLQEDTVGYKGYYYRAGPETRLEHVLTKTKK